MRHFNYPIVQKKSQNITRKQAMLKLTYLSARSLIFVIAFVGADKACNNKRDGNERGRCVTYTHVNCPAGIQRGLCTGPNERRCCLPCASACVAQENQYKRSDGKCINIGGTCQHNTNYCSTQYKSGLCGGLASRQCCKGDSAGITYGDIMKATTSGMSVSTARGYGYSERGIPASHRAARTDLSKVRAIADKFTKAETATGIDKALIAAIASRESRVGSALPPSGFGGDGHGYGIMQVDDRHHKPIISAGPKSYDNILQGATILKNSINEVQKKHSTWTKEQQLRGGIAAYNFGVSNVQTVSGTDMGTTGGDYSSDVVARAQYFKNNGF